MGVVPSEVTRIPNKPQSETRAALARRFLVARSLACPRGRAAATCIPSPMLCSTQARQADRQCKGESRNGHGNLDEPFPAATRRPPGPLDVALICTSKGGEGSKVVSGLQGPYPSTVGGPGPRAIGRSQLSGGGSINSLWRHAVEQAALSYWTQGLTSHPVVLSSPGFQLRISCEVGRKPCGSCGRTGAAGRQGGWVRGLLEHCRSSLPRHVGRVEDLVLHCEV